MRLVLALVSCLLSFSVAAAQTTSQPSTSMPIIPSSTHPYTEISPVEARVKKEESIFPNSFAVAYYKPTYILPYYYTGSPYYSVYRNNTPENERLKNSEIKYQLSFKVPVWKNMFHYPISLFLAYTQLSYWQAYNKTAFFRETDYEPELFIENEINVHLFGDWHSNLLNIGAVHQSNGYGGTMERSWNRIYAELISSNDNWMVSVKPWIVIYDSTLRRYNPDIASYLGYGQILVAYKYYRQVFSLQGRSFVGHGGKRTTGEFTWSFPITPYLNGYLQVFSGYGQSLIEYNHRTNSVGVGIALSNWV